MARAVVVAIVANNHNRSREIAAEIIREFASSFPDLRRYDCCRTLRCLQSNSHGAEAHEGRAVRALRQADK